MDGPAATESSTGSRSRRRPVVLVWLIASAVVAVLLAVIGYALLERSRSQADRVLEPGTAVETLIGSTPTGGPPAVPPQLALAPLSIVRNGNDVVLDGDLADEAAKRSLLDLVIASMGNDVNIVDRMGVTPGGKALDFAAAGPVFDAATAIPDFSLSVGGDTVTLAGTAATADEADAVADAAEQAWPHQNIVNKLGVVGPPVK